MNTQRTIPVPPKAKKIYHEEIHHGDKRVDYYSWMKDRSDPDVLAYLKAENEYTEAIMKDTEKLQEKLYDEFLSRIKQDDVSVPYKFGEYNYYYKEAEGKNYIIYFRKKDIPEASEELILDVNEIARDLNYCSVQIIPSPDSKFLAYLVDSKGDFTCTAYFKNLSTGELLEDEIKNVGWLEWYNDDKTLLYVVFEQGNKGKQVYKHTLGTRLNEDLLIYQENDDEYWVGLAKSKSKQFLFLTSDNINSTEIYYLDADNPDAALNLIQMRLKDIRITPEHNGDKFYFLTNFGAMNYRIMTAPIDKPDIENWVEFIPETKNVKIEEFQLFKDYLVLIERDCGLIKIKVINLNDISFHYIKFPEPIYCVYTEDNYEYNTNFVRFCYMSLITPRSRYDHNMKTDENILLKQQEIPGGYNKDEYISERILAPAKDGELIPVSLVYKKGINKNGKAPMFINSYGAYGYSSEIWFSVLRISLLDRGIIFAVAHIRGGGELGEKWYEGGKLLNKKNTFTDFISSCEYLIEQGYTYPKGIAAIGGSAGGTLMGAVANMRPDLFNGVIALVPAVDFLNTLLNLSTENAKVHYNEDGDPNIKEYYFYIKSYMPYENIIEQEYPNILVTTGLNDGNVRYWEPVKYVAKMRDFKKDDNILILKTDLESAHFGPSGRYDFFREEAFHFAFVLKCFGIKE